MVRIVCANPILRRCPHLVQWLPHPTVKRWAMLAPNVALFHDHRWTGPITFTITPRICSRICSSNPGTCIAEKSFKQHPSHFCEGDKDANGNSGPHLSYRVLMRTTLLHIEEYRRDTHCIFQCTTCSANCFDACGCFIAGVSYKQRLSYDNVGDDEDDLVLPQGSLSWRAEVVQITALNDRDRENAEAASSYVSGYGWFWSRLGTVFPSWNNDVFVFLPRIYVRSHDCVELLILRLELYCVHA